MKITLMDRSLYFKGLLLVVRKDNIIDDAERDLMLRVGKNFGYEPHFCEDRIRDVLINPYIKDEPPIFSDPRIAQCFIRDGLRLSLSDGCIQKEESAWLERVADKNGLPAVWYSQTVNTVSEETDEEPEKRFDAFHLEWS
jgi:hypothetical protein